MYYFINEYLLPKNSSVEHAAMQRVQLFTHYRVPAKVVTKAYDRLLHQTMPDFGLTDSQVLNMFDYFQQATPQVVHTEDLNLPCEYAIDVGANVSQVFNGDDLVAKVGFIPGSIGQVFYQEHYDNQGNLMATDLWDYRGFKSATQYFGQNGELIMERDYTPQGQVVLEQYFVADTQNQPLLSRVILKTGSNDHFFANLDELFVFFLTQLSHDKVASVTFISDRPGTGILPLLQLDSHVRKYVMVPIYHALDIHDPLHAPLDGFLQPAFDNLQRFDGFITTTSAQAQQLQQRYPTAKVTAISPVAVSKQNVPPVQSRPRQLLYVGRLAADRQLEQLIRVVALVKAQLPTVQFDLRGFGDVDYCQTLTQLIQTLGLTENVHLIDYRPDFADQYESYQVLLNADLANGGPLAMMEALAHGLPVVSYRFNYGPQDFIENGRNGWLIDPGDQLAMSQKIIGLLTQSHQLAAFSQAAMASAQTKWGRLKVWHQWQQLLGC
ncbi:glycosyltransferase [Lactiplantibacillus daowaiensis]|uniref:Glycosyltransferase n=1 Tax=Lactiplantibacillus daowaiensis TaxID=2559918 RepID=A0ABW1S1B2_9LACO|nr:glycosyltransferase [Lactiplantibacillus daowaiensis]